MLFGQILVNQMREAHLVRVLDCFDCELSSAASLLEFLNLLDVVGVNVVVEDLIECFVDLLRVKAIWWNVEVFIRISMDLQSPVEKHHCNLSLA